MVAPQVEMHFVNLKTVATAVASNLTQCLPNTPNTSSASTISLFRADKMQFVNVDKFRPQWRRQTDVVEHTWRALNHELDAISVTWFAEGWTMHREWGTPSKMIPVASTTDWFMMAQPEPNVLLHESELRVTARVDLVHGTAVVSLMPKAGILLRILQDAILTHMATKSIIRARPMCRLDCHDNSGWVQTPLMNGHWVVREEPPQQCSNTTFGGRVVSVFFGAPIAVLSAASPFLYAYAASN